MNFEFSTAGRIIFGPGTIEAVPALISGWGRRALVISGSSTQRVEPLIDLINGMGISTVLFQVPREPTTEIVLEGSTLARIEECDMVIGCGGGSVIDTGKAVSALMTNPGDIFDYLEVIGHAHEIALSPAPYIAIPTTAGTGTEVTRNAVITSQEHKVKVSMRSNLMLPRVVVVDPEITHSMPPSVTAHTGLDAFTQLLEAFVSKKSNPLTDGICIQGLSRAARSMFTVYTDGKNASAREDMALASLFSGLALANAGLGAVHGFAAVIGGRFPAPHGLVCARLLPPVVEMNISALSSRDPSSAALKRYDEVAAIITGNLRARARDGIHWIQELCSSMDIPSLRSIGLSEDDFPSVVAQSRKASSMRGNPIELTEEELHEILVKSVS
ncbi:MAG: iron-containing alcohol dehydrogenase [Desulfomonilia bacterium]